MTNSWEDASKSSRKEAEAAGAIRGRGPAQDTEIEIDQEAEIDTEDKDPLEGHHQETNAIFVNNQDTGMEE